MTLWNLLQPWVHCDTAKPHRTKVTLLYSRTLWDKGSMVTLQNCCWSIKAHGTKIHRGTKEIIVTLGNLMEPRVHCYTEDPRRPW